MTIAANTENTEKADEALVPAEPRRMNLITGLPDFYKAMCALEEAASSGLDPAVKELVKIRASQINGCAFCVDMHTRDARAIGLSEQKLFGVSVWRDTPFFTARERAALALSEAITRLGERGVPDDVYDEAAGLFDADELPRLIASCVTINAWNRISIATRMSPTQRHSD
ncbi:carboxymuconolactone decarboxylase family protein [Streptomyces sp. RB6PN25]|uniref:Carboxymuconolactone decarboxylase family protein n=1 Tax=Streptomyces humicola TaxID=2953240 RepID=A0ABT1PY03_9ACTN|nr:carboxymuconolactone decarboxylase family protein [Streptomyces humicola]MCQ4082561.1 carboxymuconolactone decarboxylase family protein [Streptomyces humicola]